MWGICFKMLSFASTINAVVNLSISFILNWLQIWPQKKNKCILPRQEERLNVCRFLTAVIWSSRRMRESFEKWTVRLHTAFIIHAFYVVLWQRLEMLTDFSMFFPNRCWNTQYFQIEWFCTAKNSICLLARTTRNSYIIEWMGIRRPASTVSATANNNKADEMVWQFVNYLSTLDFEHSQSFSIRTRRCKLVAFCWNDMKQ